MKEITQRIIRQFRDLSCYCYDISRWLRCLVYLGGEGDTEILVAEVNSKMTIGRL